MKDPISPSVQAMNLIRYIGDEVLNTGCPIQTLPDISATIGAQSAEFASGLLVDLEEHGLVRMEISGRRRRGWNIYTDVNLSLAGWDRYEAEKRGELSGNYGFLARKFNDPDLDKFVCDVLRPAVEKSSGYKLHDMNDLSKAGVIDNIMRIAVRDAKFVLVDLTHDNNGAYWEAGYAEGLGKPVIYLCEKRKFDAKNTHFDTNHCTTVPWDRNDDADFRSRLTATLRRSLESS